jgi:hypothetical protein
MTALYVPPTEESDYKKQNMSLQLIGGATSTNTTNITTNSASITALQAQTTGYEAAWTTYVPVVSAFGGTITTSSATGRYLKIGKTVIVSMIVTITTNGTGSGFVKATLPFTAGSGQYGLAGRENASTGAMLQGFITAAATTVAIFKYDGTYPGGSGFELTVSGAYESA